MRHRLSTLGICLLVLAFLAMGLVACSRSAEERTSQPTQPAETPATQEASTGGATSVAPGETVVSAVTPQGETPGAAVQPATAVPAGETPGVSEAQTPAAPEATAVPPASSAPATGEGDVIWHTVQPGETLSSIAQRYGTTWQAVAQANGLVNPNQIYAGQKLKIPTSSAGTSGGATGCRIRHTVQPGEWVWQIARHYGVSPYDILAANGLTVQTANTIYPGAVLCIP